MTSDIRKRLWLFLGDRGAAPPAIRPRDEILADLLRSNQSIILNLDDLKRRASAARAAPAEPGKGAGVSGSRHARA